MTFPHGLVVLSLLLVHPLFVVGPAVDCPGLDVFRPTMELLAEGKTKQAIACLTKHVAAHDSDLDALLALGRHYNRLGFFREALDYSVDALNVQPLNEDSLLLHQSNLVGLHMLDRAQRILELMLKTNESSVPALQGLAKVHMRRGDNGLAVAVLEEAIAIDVFDATSHHLAGLCYEKLSDISAAEAALLSAVRLYSDGVSVDASRDLARVLGKRLTATTGRAMVPIAIVPSIDNVYLRVGRVFEASGRTDMALDCFQTANSLASNKTLSHYEIARLALLMGNVTLAIAHSSSYVDSSGGTPQSLRLLAQCLEAHGSEESIADANSVYTHLILSDPNDAQALQDYARFLKAQKRYPQAAVRLRELAALLPHQSDILSDLASVLMSMEEYREAASVFADISRMSPSAESYLDHIHSLIFLYEVSKSSIDLDAASYVLNMALVRFPKDTSLLRLAVDLADMNNDHSGAVFALSQLSAVVRSWRVSEELGDRYVKGRDYFLALDMYELAVGQLSDETLGREWEEKKKGSQAREGEERSRRRSSLKTTAKMRRRSRRAPDLSDDEPKGPGRAYYDGQRSEETADQEVGPGQVSTQGEPSSTGVVVSWMRKLFIKLTRSLYLSASDGFTSAMRLATAHTRASNGGSPPPPSISSSSSSPLSAFLDGLLQSEELMQDWDVALEGEVDSHKLAAWLMEVRAHLSGSVTF